MPHDSDDSLVPVPILSLQARRLLAELGQFLADSGDRYVTHLRTELQLCLEAAQLDQFRPCAPIPVERKVLPFPPRSRAGESLRGD